MKKITDKMPVLIAICIFASGLLYNSCFTVRESQKAIVLYLGKISRTHVDCGLKFKYPFVEEVVFLDKRLQGYVLPILEVNDAQRKKLVVDVFARYVISNPELYMKNIGATGPGIFQRSSVIDQRLNRYVSSALRNAIGGHLLSDLLSDKRAAIMTEITNNVQAEAKKIGILVEDVRLVKSNLPKANSEKVFLRMESDRMKVARRIRSEGDEEARKITSQADRRTKEIIALASRDGKMTVGEGEAAAIAIMNKVIAKDPQFFQYVRKLEAYQKSLTGASYVLSMDSNFFSGLLGNQAHYKRGKQKTSK